MFIVPVIPHKRWRPSTPADPGLFVPDKTAAGGWRYIAHPTPQASEGYEIRVDVFGLRYAYALNS